MPINDYMAAPLVRGTLIHLLNRPCVVIGGPDSPDARKVDVSAAFSGGAPDEDRLVELIKLAIGEQPDSLPTALQLFSAGNSRTFWSGLTLEAVQKRIATGNAEPWSAEPLQAPDSRSAAGRSTVVEGRVALVTGGAQGFGEEITRGLAASGALVFIADINLAGAISLADTLNAEAGKTVAIAVEGNVADETSIEGMFRTIAKKAGGLDLCVSNAGVLKAGSVLEQSRDDFQFVTDVNYTGFFLVTKHAARLLKKQSMAAPGWLTDIIQINSKSGLEGSNRNGAYAGGKFGGIGLVASFALELIDFGIKVNALCPGNFFDGPLWSDPDRGLFVQYLKAGKVPGAVTVADVKAFYESKVPMRRGCGGGDVMRALYYVVEQAYETGQAVPVTGGQVMLH